jgi:hypothetical protein
VLGSPPPKAPRAAAAPARLPWALAVKGLTTEAEYEAASAAVRDAIAAENAAAAAARPASPPVAGSPTRRGRPTAWPTVGGDETAHVLPPMARSPSPVRGGLRRFAGRQR